MGFNQKTVLHIIGIMLIVFLLLWCAVNTTYYATMLTLSLILAFQVHALLRFISNTNRQLSRFLDAVKYSDFSQSFSHQALQGSFATLGHSIDEVLDRFREERSAKEAQATFLNAFVEQVPIAILAIEETGIIAVSNKALRRLIGKSEIRNLQQIQDFSPVLANLMSALKAGEEKTIKINTDSGFQHLKISCSLLRIQGQLIRIISLQDIRDELETAELEAWQNLIRVMTHEIMNSITPITSLAETSAQYLKEVSANAEHAGVSKNNLTLLRDAESAIETISKRSQGLMRFVESYRTLTRLPTPEFDTFLVDDLFRRVTELMEQQAVEKQIQISVSCKPSNLDVKADSEMLEQALINLLLNAMDAVAETDKPHIQLKAQLKERGGVMLSVQDNGTGIAAENLDNIFIPFFTTKRGGSGIGMSIVKQIVKLNGGHISVSSSKASGTCINLSFN